ncbi:aldehyde dehydrogenase [Carex littledalei]|uniref:Aldehyde dehydrogenase n=1 Tax=Carex littledalei TaxID=544730 RepID=A0A833QY53_9POAL|nr:aldehyde dehydrogenase [Carex littledalei]
MRTRPSPTVISGHRRGQSKVAISYGLISLGFRVVSRNGRLDFWQAVVSLVEETGALYMGNKPVLKVDSKVSIVMDQMLRLLHECGLPLEDADIINSDGAAMKKLLLEAKPKMTLFTGSSRVAEKLAADLKGRIKLEDAGFDWKILGF